MIISNLYIYFLERYSEKYSLEAVYFQQQEIYLHFIKIFKANMSLAWLIKYFEVLNSCAKSFLN